MQRELGARYAQSPGVLNIPGRSLACKIDPFYYLAPYPGFINHLAEWCAIKPEKAGEALVRTGNIITRGGDRSPFLFLNLAWGEGGRGTPRFKACLVHAAFIDRAVKLYGGGQEPSISLLRVQASDRELVERFLEGKTLLASFAYQE